jgi:NADPH:quinone reductase-like Zn-dependent oxidoreductase
MIAGAGIEPVDRSAFADLSVPPQPRDREALVKHMKAERALLRVVDEVTGGDRVSIFIDNIGGSLAGPTIRALGRQGVVATTGWKRGLEIEFNRALACINRHTFVHTHACPLHEGIEAVEYAASTGWIPHRQDRIYRWDEVPQLAEDHAAGRVASYFPTFAAPATDHL